MCVNVVERPSDDQKYERNSKHEGLLSSAWRPTSTIKTPMATYSLLSTLVYNKPNVEFICWEPYN